MPDFEMTAKVLQSAMAEVHVLKKRQVDLIYLIDIIKPVECRTV